MGLKLKRHRTDKELLGAYSSGNDKAAFEEFYDRYAASLYRQMSLYTNKTDFVEDALQNLIRKVLSQTHLFASAQNVREYLFKSARYEILSRLKSESKHAEAIANSPAAEPTQKTQSLSISGFEELDSIEQLISPLPLEQREVIFLKCVEGMTFREIAGAQNISPDNAESRYRYGIQKLRRLWS